MQKIAEMEEEMAFSGRMFQSFERNLAIPGIPEELSWKRNNLLLNFVRTLGNLSRDAINISVV